MLMDNVTGWIRKLTEAGVAAIALAVVVQVILVLVLHSFQGM
jgi:negative regulator of sigma E activity